MLKKQIFKMETGKLLVKGLSEKWVGVERVLLFLLSLFFVFLGGFLSFFVCFFLLAFVFVVAGVVVCLFIYFFVFSSWLLFLASIF